MQKRKLRDFKVFPMLKRFSIRDNLYFRAINLSGMSIREHLSLSYPRRIHPRKVFTFHPVQINTLLHFNSLYYEKISSRNDRNHGLGFDGLR